LDDVRAATLPGSQPLTVLVTVIACSLIVNYRNAPRSRHPQFPPPPWLAF
jgi:hypothetical protein